MINKKLLNAKLNKYIFSSVLAMLGTSCYILADTFFISVAAGANGITALNLALPVYAIMFAIGSMTGIGSATQYSLDKAMGREGYETYFSNSVLWTLMISVTFVLLGIFIPEKVLQLMGANQAILETGLPYLRIVLLMAPAFMLNYTMTAFVRNDNAPKIAMAATLISSFLNIILDYTFMFPLQMGMKGAALATGMSPIISMSVCMMHYLSVRNTIRFVWKIPDWGKLIKSCMLGVPGFVGEIASGVTTLCFNYVLLSLVGNIGVAAYGIVANISLIGIAIFNGVSQGLQPMASEAVGTGDKEAQKQICKHSEIIGVVTAAILVLVCCIFTKSIVMIFNSEQSREMAFYAERGLRMYSWGFFVAAVNIVKSGYYSAIGEAWACSFISLLRGIVAIVLFVLILPQMIGVYGVWLAFPAAEIFTYIVSALIIRNKNRL